MISSRTPEGDAGRCPVCGHDCRLEPSWPARDAPCPSCGHLLWFDVPRFDEPRAASADAESALLELLEMRFGPIPEGVAEAVERLTAEGDVRALVRRAVTAGSWEELTRPAVGRPPSTPVVPRHAFPMPAALRDRLGEPEEVFGPNRRFLAGPTLVGATLILLGVGSVAVWAIALWVGKAAGLWRFLLLGIALVACGLALILASRVPPTWVFVCPRGLARLRGADWDAIGWPRVARVEDSRLTAGVAGRQCRVVLAGGGEWAFAAGCVAGFGRLAETLCRKLAESRAGGGPDEGTRQTGAN